MGLYWDSSLTIFMEADLQLFRNKGGSTNIHTLSEYHITPCMYGHNSRIGQKYVGSLLSISFVKVCINMYVSPGSVAIFAYLRTYAHLIILFYAYRVHGLSQVFPLSFSLNWPFFFHFQGHSHSIGYTYILLVSTRDKDTSL